MSRSSIMLLVSICIGIIAFTTWQYGIHNKLQDLPRTCTGPKFTDNGCPSGSACVYPEGMQTTSSIAVPTNREQVLDNINSIKDGEGNRVVGSCTPWIDIMVNTSAANTTDQTQSNN